MIQPGNYHITIQQGADFSLAFQLKDSNDDPINLTGATVESEIWSAGKRYKMADFTVAITSAATGEFSINLTKIQTANLTESGYYDIRVTIGTTSNYWVRGQARLETGYTE